MHALLIAHGLWGFVSGSERLEGCADVKAVAFFHSQSLFAFNLISFHVKEELETWILDQVIHGDARGLWIHLSAICASGSSTASTTMMPAPVPRNKCLYASEQALISSPSDNLIRWNADTGATSSMTPHRALFHDYKPHKRSIHLANGSTIYSEGIGSILFIPLINGTKSRPVLFSEVLHVPSLSNNLLSVLSIVSRRNIVVTIQNRSMLFSLNNETLFEAEITPHNAAFLLGETLTPSESCMGAISTLP